MYKLYHYILDFSEVWALLIPLAVILWRKNNAAYLKPIRIFLIITLLLNIGIVIISEYKGKLNIPEGSFFWSNNFLYNLGSIVRFLLFAWFFNRLNQRFMHRIKAIIPYGFLLFVFINFAFYEDFFYQNSFSSRLLATEAALLLFYCLQYFIFIIIDEKNIKLINRPGIWIVTGLSIYVAVNFFIFLFYTYLSDIKRNFAVNIWDVHNIVFILLCILIARQLSEKNG